QRRRKRCHVARQRLGIRGGKCHQPARERNRIVIDGINRISAEQVEEDSARTLDVRSNVFSRHDVNRHPAIDECRNEWQEALRMA
ncbi:hypothetical protein, partial [Salmonella sp. SAL4444]|uniref:hypothetical protein n=1 Tax=Salmonella sp. SAL4444 TaxID=3159899 RepID=UPI00397824DC